ncbi:hypothetical protein ATANTOWER_018031, partial [Ataeniobius toweri]|nr:hypothetical protein [Ataeniobius toweri]
RHNSEDESGFDRRRGLRYFSSVRETSRKDVEEDGPPEVSRVQELLKKFGSEISTYKVVGDSEKGIHKKHNPGARGET